MKTTLCLVLAFVILSCGNTCPPRPKNCPSCSAIFEGNANPADLCPSSQIQGCGNPWGPLGGCASSKCSAQCGVLAPKNFEPCLSCLKLSCSSELSACLSDK